MLIDITAFVVGIGLVYGHAYTVKFLSEYLQKEQIKKQFGGYVSPVMVERLQKNPDLIKLGGERKLISSVMTDLRGFTTLGESYGDDVEGLTQIMNDYMTAISEPVLKNDGCIIKFIGDASLHIHGAPLDDENHAKVAVQTGLEMVEAVTQFNKQLISLGKPPVGMGVGVNSGPILVGNIGSKYRFGYDVLGDTVSLTSRLEGQTKGYGVLLILGETTAELVKDDFKLAELDCIAVKGKHIGVKMFTVAETLPAHQQYLNAYYAGDWGSARVICKHLAEQPGPLQHYYELMLERISGECPANWDGVFHALSK
jgi:adenylate cyclase